MTSVDIAALVADLPKVELHLHLQGAASATTVLGLSRRYPEVGLPTDADAMAESYRFTDFTNFVRVYVAVSRLVRTGDDLKDLVTGLGRDLAGSSVRYAEVTVTPDSHLLVGIAPDELTDALDRGRAAALDRHGVEIAWVFDIDGELGVPSGERAVAWAEGHLPEGSVGFGIGGLEVGVDRPAFRRVFDRARDLGLRSVPHAGETTGPQTIRDSIDELGAVRIGHGIAAAQDPSLMADLVDRDIVLEVCPTSNVRTRAVDDLDSHPFRVLREAGVRMTLNTDDPGMFDTDLDREYVIAHEVFGLDRAELVDLARESVRASFAPAATRHRVMAEIDAYAGSVDRA